ncbi:MAG: hypothetical protein JOZ08_21670 [Verrucomicrobia bacterium]|nr:hypothetical protein [Verrucomicrobiota bacterium]MBV8273794.1 hypothetical protein [Verrucomicrobiota bacterium]
MKTPISIILAAGLLAATAFAAETLPFTIESGTVTYTVTSAYLDTHFENIVPPEGAYYLIIQLTAKNSSPKRFSLGGLFGKNFSAEKGGYKYDVDGGVGWQTSAYSGTASLEPLIPRKLSVLFSVPAEIAVGTWTVHFPTGKNFDVDVDLRKAPAKGKAKKK